MKSALSKLMFLGVSLGVLLCSCTAMEQDLATNEAAEAAAVSPTRAQEQAAPAGMSEAESVKQEPLEAARKEATAAESQPVQTDAEPAPAKPAEGEAIARPEPVAEEKPVEGRIVLAEIGDYTITKDDLMQRYIAELRSYLAEPIPKAEPDDINMVLMEMVAEKAMLIEGRKKNLLEDSIWLKEYNERDLINLLMADELSDKVEVSEAEIEKKLKSDPKLDREKARAAVQRDKARKLSEEFYKRVCSERDVQKLRYNFPKAAQIHQRLLMRPQQERSAYWIQKTQIQDETTQEEKDIALATFKGGKVTVEDWLYALHQIVPPRRPKNLNTVEGVDSLLERALRSPVLVTEARSRGLDKNPQYVERVREREDRLLLGRVRNEVLSDKVDKPTDEETSDYFEKHKEQFKRADTVKIKQIWCEDIETARKAKAELSGGKDFDAVVEQYSIKKEHEPVKATAATEGIFFDRLWQAEPNQITGPMQGFYAEKGRRPAWQIKWRVVKIVQKTAGEARKYSSGVARDVKDAIYRKRRDEALAEYQKGLLEKYSYTVYADRIKDMDLPAVGPG